MKNNKKQNKLVFVKLTVKETAHIKGSGDPGADCMDGEVPGRFICNSEG